MRAISLDQIDLELPNLKFDKRENVSLLVDLVETKETLYLNLAKIFENNFGQSPKRIAQYPSKDPMSMRRSLLDLKDDSFLGIKGIVISEGIQFKVQFGPVYEYITITEYFLINPSPKLQTLKFELENTPRWRLNEEDWISRFAPSDLTKIMPPSLDVARVYRETSTRQNKIHITKLLKHIHTKFKKHQKHKKTTETAIVTASFEMMKLLAKLNEDIGDDIFGTVDSTGTKLFYNTVRGRFIFTCRIKDNLYDIYGTEKYWRWGASREETAAFICGLVHGGMIVK